STSTRVFPVPADASSATFLIGSVARSRAARSRSRAGSTPPASGAPSSKAKRRCSLIARLLECLAAHLVEGTETAERTGHGPRREVARANVVEGLDHALFGRLERLVQRLTLAGPYRARRRLALHRQVEGLAGREARGAFLAQLLGHRRGVDLQLHRLLRIRQEPRLVVDDPEGTVGQQVHPIDLRAQPYGARPSVVAELEDGVERVFDQAAED